MEALKVTFRVMGGVVSPPMPIHLDALLAYAETQARLDPDDPYAPKDVQAMRAIADDLPLERFERDGEWVWKASALVPVGVSSGGSRFFTQRMNKKDFAIRVGEGDVQLGRYQHDKSLPAGANMTPYQNKIDTLRGPFRNLLGFYPVFDPNALVAWCIGDRERIKDILRNGHITHIGARRRSGHGEIKDILIEPDSQADELWMRRVRPWPLLDEDVAIQAAWQAPYWAAENRGEAFCPKSLF